MLEALIRKALAEKAQRDEATVRRLLSQYVSEIEPSIALNPSGEIIGLCAASAELGSTPFIFKGVATMTMLEKVARAIASTPEFFGRPPWFPKEPDGSVYSPTAIAMLKVAWEHDHGPWENWLKARAAITALREPTEAMKTAKGIQTNCPMCGGHVEGWQMMLDAVLK